MSQDWAIRPRGLNQQIWRLGGEDAEKDTAGASGSQSEFCQLASSLIYTRPSI